MSLNPTAEQLLAYTSRPKVYLAGPMRGVKNYNFANFYKAAAMLNMWGFNVANPAEMDLIVDEVIFEPATNTVVLAERWDEQQTMRRDFDAIRESTAVVFLPGWENSTGAKREYAYASACGIPCYLYDESTPLRLDVTPVIDAKVEIALVRPATISDDLPF